MRLILSRLLPVLILTGSAALHASAVRDFSGSSLAVLGPNDDGSFVNVLLPFTLNFFGSSQNIVSVNNNGNLTFGLNNSQSIYTPYGLTQPLGFPIVAPFFADVDTRGPGSSVVTFGNVTVDSHTAFVANYVDVGYFNQQADKLNSFQALLIDRSDIGPGDFDIEFNYDRLLWETGSASRGVNGFGGFSARTGFSNGSGAAGTNLELPGSGINGALLDGGPNSLIATSFNSPVLGRYVFPVRNGRPAQPGDTPALPINPSELVPGGPGQAPLFVFNNQPSGRWFDPPIVYGFEFDMLSPGQSFAELRLPAGSPLQGLTLSYGQTRVGPFSGDAFSYLFPAGVTEFRITGINPLLDPTSPGFSSAFPAWLSFSSATASFSMTPLTTPEPGTWLSLLAGLGLVVMRRQRG